MKWSELRRIAENKGFVFLRHGGRHDIYQHPITKVKIAIGHHGSQEVATGTLASLRKQIGF